MSQPRPLGVTGASDAVLVCALRATRRRKGQRQGYGSGRGPSSITARTCQAMMKVIAADKRQTIYEQLERFVSTPRGAFEFVKDFADRTDGRPTQRHQVSVPRTTIFQEDPTLAPPTIVGAGDSAAPELDGVLVADDGQTFVALRERM